MSSLCFVFKVIIYSQSLKVEHLKNEPIVLSIFSSTNEIPFLVSKNKKKTLWFSALKVLFSFLMCLLLVSHTKSSKIKYLTRNTPSTSYYNIVLLLGNKQKKLEITKTTIILIKRIHNWLLWNFILFFSFVFLAFCIRDKKYYQKFVLKQNRNIQKEWKEELFYIQTYTHTHSTIFWENRPSHQPKK